MKELFKLYWIFFKMGIVNFGGGYAMLPLLQEEIVEKRNFCTEQEINDYYAAGQCTPGLISVNVSTFIGYKLKKIPGAIFTTLGFISPSYIIILIIAMVLKNFMDNQYVLNAFAGINVAVAVLMIKATVKMVRKSVIDIYTLLIFTIILTLCILPDFISSFPAISPIIFVVLSGFVGVSINKLREHQMLKKHEEGGEEL